MKGASFPNTIIFYFHSVHTAMTSLLQCVSRQQTSSPAAQQSGEMGCCAKWGDGLLQHGEIWGGFGWQDRSNYGSLLQKSPTKETSSLQKRPVI